MSTAAASRALLDEIAALREDIHKMAGVLNNIDLSIVMLFQELRAPRNGVRSPLYHPPAEE
jgi:hypothetical protein